MRKTIMITGASSGFGKGAAIGLAKKGHRVVATVQVDSLKTMLLEDIKEEGVEMEVIVVDITKEEDRRLAFAYDVDVLINNAGTMQTGPAGEIPMDRVRENYEVNVFGTLAFTQGFLPKMAEKRSGKVIFTSSVGGLVTMPFASIYTSTKHALESIAEGLKEELKGTGIEICTVNPGIFGTGFNDRGAETMMKWFSPQKSLCSPQVIEEILESGGLDDQLDPELMIEAMIRVAEEDSSSFRNVVPEAIVPWIKKTQEVAWAAKKNDSLTVDLNSL